MKLFTTKQIGELDRYTIENEPITDIDLMERASAQVSGWLGNHFPIKTPFVFFIGSGNNGGDGLAVARQLGELDYKCKVFLPDFDRELSPSSLINLDRLKKQGKAEVKMFKKISDFPSVSDDSILVDGLFGSGLKRPLTGFASDIVMAINKLGNTKISIDIPSGLMGEDNAVNNSDGIIKATYTLTFQFPKISFLFSENEKFTGKWEVLPIGLHPDGIEMAETSYYLTDEKVVKNLIPPRRKFAHKGDFGHALLLSGSLGKMGAAVLASKACLRAGCGLVTTHIPRSGYYILQTAVPEAMVSIDKNEEVISMFPDLSAFSAIGIGPGLGKSAETAIALLNLLRASKMPMVVDADALNIIAENKEWLKFLPNNTILTPHPGEFRRLAGESANSFERIQKQITFSKNHNVIIVLKGAYSTVSFPDGNIFFNSTGNPGMATAGSGDVLTGIILGLLSQGIGPEYAALAGVYLHGLAGDLAAEAESEHSLIAGDILENMGKAFRVFNP